MGTRQLVVRMFVAVVLGVALAMPFGLAGVGRSLSGEGTIDSQPLPQPTAEVIYTKPANYATLVSWYQALAAKYPNYVEVIEANTLYGTGTITGGYNYYIVRLTNESKGLLKPEVLFVGNPHGDETVGTIAQYWFCNWTLRSCFDPGWANDKSTWLKWMLDNREVYFVVSENPYGFDNGPQRADGNGWDLNRESDMDGPDPSGGPPAIWSSVNGKTLREFVNHHQIRTGSDFHGGARMLLYPWGSTHASVTGVSQITGQSYTYAPPDFNYFDASGLRLGSYMGSYGGVLDRTNIGTIPPTVGYTAMGGLGPWGYGSDVTKNPREAAYVDAPPYPGGGILWFSPELSATKNPAQATFGGDTTLGWGIDVRRFIMHQIDLAQPYVPFASTSVANNTVANPGSTIHIRWQVNGSMVVDHTYVQWGNNPNPISSPQYSTTDFNANAGHYVGGTGWEGAASGSTPSGVTYDQAITMPTTPGDYYFVVKAKVDQVYANTLSSPDYDANHPYLRLVKERAQPGYYENLTGTDGTERMQYHEWWYSSIIRIHVPSMSAGVISLDKDVYRIPDTAAVTVIDSDLNTNNATIQTTVVTVSSTSEPAGEPVTLTETGPATGAFTGTIALSGTNSVGVLWVQDGNVVTATYNDAFNGTGPATVTDTATVDGDPPGPPTGLSVTWSGTTTTTLSSQNFTSATFPPTGWQVLGNGTTGTWSRQPTANAGGTSPEARFMYGNTGQGTSRLICGPISTTGMTTLNLSWNGFIDAYGTGVTCRIQTATAAAGPWTNTNWVWTGSATDRGPQLEATTLTTSHNVGSATFYYAFVVIGNSYQLDYWYVDNALLTSTAASTNDNKLTWVKSADDGAGANDVDHYNIYRSNAQSGPWDTGHVITTVAKGVQTYTDPGRGQPDGINWWYVVRAADTSGYTEMNVNAVPEMAVAAWANITVNSTGWNLISVPLVTASTGLPGALTDKANGGAGLVQWNRVMRYNPTATEKWKQYNSGWNAALNDLTSVNHTVGLWINVTSLGDGQICVGGSDYSAPSGIAIPLKAGWNLVGFPSGSTTYTVGNLKSAVPSIDIVEGFMPSQTYRTTVLGNAQLLAAGRAYWIHTTADATWTLP